MDRSETVFRILIAYEDFEAGIRARKLADSLATRLGSGWSVQSDSWKFELIAHLRLREIITRATGEADMIIIAAKGGEELPSWVKGWLETWAPCHRSDPVALVALLHGPEPDVFDANIPAEKSPDVVLDYLRRVATRARADLFCCEEEAHALSFLEQGHHSGGEASLFGRDFASVK